MPPRKFEASDKAQEPAALTKAITDQLRELISGSVPGLVDEYASATGLQLSEQFQADMTQAILASVLLHGMHRSVSVTAFYARSWRASKSKPLWWQVACAASKPHSIT